MEKEADNRGSGVVLERALGARWLPVVGREGDCMMDAGDSGGECARQASFSVLALPWEEENEVEGEEEDKCIHGIFHGKTTI